MIQNHDAALPMKLHRTAGWVESNAQSPHNIVRPGGIDCWLMEYVASGAVRINWDDDHFIMEEGTIFCFPPLVKHDYVMAPFWNHYWVVFPLRAGWRELLDWPTLPNGVLHFKIDDIAMREKVCATYREMVSTMQSVMPRRQEMLMNLVENLLLWLDTVNPISERQKTDERIQEVLEYLCQNFSEKVSLSDMAEICHLSVSRFCHLFQNQMQCTPMKFIEDYRMSRAGELLQMTSEPIAEVARRVGYDDPLYFSKVFRRNMKNSPKAYRQSGRG
ncbi:MAG: AraC family transcriptional regulator [Planctomycetes bacterium]|nr:AraC family transcriptional regulator [Planctomycetota bacterium]